MSNRRSYNAVHLYWRVCGCIQRAAVLLPSRHHERGLWSDRHTTDLQVCAEGVDVRVMHMHGLQDNRHDGFHGTT